MPRTQSLLPLLRPLTASTRAPCEQLFRFSTAARLRVPQPSATTPGPAASLQKPPKAPKPSPEAPSTPKEAARQADLAAVEAATEADNPNAPAPKPTLPSKRPESSIPSATKPSANPKPVKAPSKAKTSSKTKPNAVQNITLELPPPRYHVARSSSKNLPIYTDYKRGGNLHLTTIRKITGDLSALRDELRVFLNKKNEDVKINSLTQHVIVKGHHVPQITDFLKARGM